MASPQNYTLGRGKLHFATFKPGTQIPGGYRYIGNTPSITMTSEPENLDHYSSDEGVRQKDESILLQLDRSGAFTTDSIRPANVALLLMGDYSTVSTAAGTGSETEIPEAQQGLTYQLGVSPTSPAGARLVSNVVVKDTAATPVTYVAGTDYVVDAERGLLTILETTTGGIADDTDLEVTFDVGASSRIQIVSGSQPIEGSLLYKSANPAGEQFDYMWPWVKITPNGDFELKGDEWQTLPFNFEVLTKDGMQSVYVNGIARSTAGG